MAVAGSNILNFIVWQPNPIAIDFGVISLSWYGLTWSLSIIASYFLAKIILKKEGKSEHYAVLLIQYLFIGAILGARIFDVLYYHWHEFLARPFLIFEIWNGGMASHGAMLGVMCCILLFIKKYKEFTFLWILDKVAIVSALSSVFIRLGNFMNSELYGKPTDLPWAMVFPLKDSLLLPRHPVQLYEAFWYLICFLTFWYLFSTRKLKDGFLTALFGIMFLGGRFIIEFVKEPDVFFGPFTNTQWLSLFFVAVGILMMIRGKLYVTEKRTTQ
ncbi:MAG: prolipoprotein diacylglyceryl transferase [Bacteroidetes bacterium]|nr:prolipoprotein diacylglyceryl transferase [Bacteroidota bacterium]